VSKHSRRRQQNPSRKLVPQVQEEFTGKVQTKYGGAGLLRRFVGKLKLSRRLSRVSGPAPGRCFTTRDFLQGLLWGLLLGQQRQSAVAQLGQDPAALLALGLPDMPSQPSLSRFLSSCTERMGQQVLQINRALVRELRGPRAVATLDLDGEVVSTRGNPEGASYGYNPGRKGAKSYFALLGFWGEWRDILHAELYPGNQATVSADMAIRAYRMAKRGLPWGVRRVRLRADVAFYSHKFLAELEADQVTYCLAARMTAPLQPLVLGLEYRVLDDKWSIAEVQYRGHDWERPRRMVVIRERLDPQNPSPGQLELLHCEGHSYQVIVTNATWPPETVWHFYNGRSRLENIIKESQTDFGGNHVLSHTWGGNQMWLALSVLAYNLMNWFRERILGQRRQRRTAGWVRRTLIEIPATLVRRGRQWRLKLWRDHPAKDLFLQAVVALEGFSP